MNALNAFRDLMGRLPRVEGGLQKPDSVYSKPRKMTGILAGLSDEQRKAALTPIEPDRAGDPAKVR